MVESWSPREKLHDSAKDAGRNHTFTSGASESATSNTCSKHIEDCTDGTEDLHARTAVLLPHQPTKVMRTTSIMEPSLIELTSVTKCPKQVHQ